jgi:hypothetical protein
MSRFAYKAVSIAFFLLAIACWSAALAGFFFQLCDLDLWLFTLSVWAIVLGIILRAAGRQAWRMARR